MPHGTVAVDGSSYNIRYIKQLPGYIDNAHCYQYGDGQRSVASGVQQAYEDFSLLEYKDFTQINHMNVKLISRFRNVMLCMIFMLPLRIPAAVAEPLATSTTVEAYRFAVEILEFPMSVERFEATLEVNARLSRVVGTDGPTGGFTLYAISSRLIAEGLVGIIAYKDPKDGRIIDASVFFYSDSLRTRFIAEPLFISRGALGEIAARRKQELRFNFRKSEMTAISFAVMQLNQSDTEPIK